MSILACAVLALSPQGELPASRPALDRILLRAGSALEGTITIDSRDYVEVKLEDGTTVGFERKIVESIERGAVARKIAEAATGGKVVPRDRWYLLHDGEGTLRGRLHETITLGEEVRICEEWQLATEKGITEVTILEVLAPDLAPVSCFFHERTKDSNADRLASERVVRARVRGSALEVVTKTLRGDETRTYELPLGASFPLAGAERARREAIGDANGLVTVFDPRSEDLHQLAWRSQGRRQVSDGKRSLDVRELRVTSGKVENLEWLDASGASLRREVNGPALVAVPTSADTARGVSKFGSVAGAGAVCKERTGRFGLWLPSPTWRGTAEAKDGKVLVSNAIDDAEVSLVAIDHVDAELGLDSVADTVARWLRLLRPDLEIEKRMKSAVRSWPAVCIQSTHVRQPGGAGNTRRTRTFVFRAHGLVLALSCEAPAKPSPGFEADLTRLLSMVEVVPEK